MSEPAETTDGAPVGDVQLPDGQVETPSEGEPKTFDEAYVKSLRDEAAANRVAKASAEERAEAAIERLMKASINAAAGDLLWDPTDLPDDVDAYTGEDGLPDPAKIRAAAEALIEAKPHLARPRSPQAQLQGPTGATPAQVGLGSLLRDASR